jgi:elongation factor P--(R)-beta-lysine ligase
VMTPSTARKRAGVINAVRTFFVQRDVLEIETPVLSAGAIADRHIDLFSLSPSGASVRYLQSSPEQHMKRLLCDGYPDIFQIARVFRQEERGRQHNPEFTMLEWYRRGFSMMHLIDEVGELCAAVLGAKPVRMVAYRDIVMEHTGLDPLTADRNDVLQYVASRGFEPRIEGSRADVFQYLFALLVEPELPKDTLLFVHSYPADQAVLAALDPDNPTVAKRFELFVGGIELANGWEELADAAQNVARAEEENAQRSTLGKQPIPLHPAFVRGLRKGLPACSGVALGLDRLIMLAAGAADIADVLTFPWDNA